MVNINLSNKLFPTTIWLTEGLATSLDMNGCHFKRFSDIGVNEHDSFNIAYVLHVC